MAKKSIGKLDFSFTDNGFIWRWDGGKTHRLFGKTEENPAPHEDEYSDNPEYTDGEPEYYDDNGGEYYDDGSQQYADNGEYYDDGSQQYADNGEYYDDGSQQYYDDGGYQDNNYYEDENGNVYYDDGNADGYYDPQADDYYDEGGNGGVMDYMTSNDWVMYAALVIFPPLGIYLLWKKNKFDMTVRSAITAASAIWFILLVWLLFFNKPTSGDTIQPGTKLPQVTLTPVGQQTRNNDVYAGETDKPEGTPEPTPEPTPVAKGYDDSGALTEDGQYVWITNTGAYYHNRETCSSIGNATPSRVELSLAESRSKSPCPECYGQEVTGTTYYATPNGKYYHLLPNCSGMNGATTITESAAQASGKSPCPTCVGYYCTKGGKYIHTRPDCSSMTGAVLMTKDQIQQLGNKTWCPICFPNKKTDAERETFTYVYATQKGTYYHSNATCSGMKDASKIKITTALASGKKACPTCISNNTLYVFATNNGTYYHIDASCSGMKDASRVTITAALAKNKKACPTCSKQMSTATGKGGKNTKDALGDITINDTGSKNNTATVTETETTVYARSDGTYYHTNATCSGMKGASKVKISTAISAGKKACPTCVTTGKLYVFATKNGTYYHTNATCSGMKDALRVTMQAASKNGKTACPKCAKNILASSNKASANTVDVKTYTSAAAASSANKATYVYARADGTYYHTKSNCSGMKDASLVKLTTASGAGKKPCTKCVSSSSMSVFATKDGDYYHTNATCSGMKGASCVTIQQAKNSGKIVCPKCAESTLSKQTSSYSAPASTKVYLDSNASRSVYHKNKNCDATGMRNGTAVTLSYALDFSYKACPYCNPASKVSK